MTAGLQNQTMALLANIRPGTTPAPTLDATDFDFARPRGFTTEKLGRLLELGERLAVEIGKELDELLHDSVEIHARPLTQYYGPQLAERLSQQKGYGAALLSEGKVCGYIWLSASGATSWVAKLLGAGEDGGGAERELSGLESTLLQDILASLVKAVAGQLPTFKGLTHDAQILRELPSAGETDAREFCEFAMAAETDTPPTVALLLHTSNVVALVEPPAAKRAPEENRKDLQKHLERVSMRGEVWLGHASVPVRDLISLEAGDVLLLNRLVGENVQLMVQGRTIASGQPARSDGNYAFQVVSRAT